METINRRVKYCIIEQELFFEQRAEVDALKGTDRASSGSVSFKELSVVRELQSPCKGITMPRQHASIMILRYRVHLSDRRVFVETILSYLRISVRPLCFCWTCILHRRRELKFSRWRNLRSNWSRTSVTYAFGFQNDLMTLWTLMIAGVLHDSTHRGLGDGKFAVSGQLNPGQTGDLRTLCQFPPHLVHGIFRHLRFPPSLLRNLCSF